MQRDWLVQTLGDLYDAGGALVCPASKERSVSRKYVFFVYGRGCAAGWPVAGLSEELWHVVLQ